MRTGGAPPRSTSPRPRRSGRRRPGAPVASARRPGAAARALAVARGLAEAQDLADVHAVALEGRRGQLQTGDDPVRVQDEPALVLDEVAADLVAALPREV